MILAINTCTKQFSLGIISEDGMVISEHILPAVKSGSRLLMPHIKLLIKDSDINIKKELSCIATCIGPGSFTGMKVGLSVAKGLCFSLNLPLIGISSLEALAIQLVDSTLPITTMIDSRKKEYFTAQFIWKQNKLVRISADRYLGIKEFPSLFNKNTIFIGNNYISQSQELKNVMGKDVLMASPHLWHIRASSIGILAAERFINNKLDDPLFLEPIYLRPPEIRDNSYKFAN